VATEVARSVTTRGLFGISSRRRAVELSVKARAHGCSRVTSTTAAPAGSSSVRRTSPRAAGTTHAGTWSGAPASGCGEGEGEGSCEGATEQAASRDATKQKRTT
jgi:hypothetical protein